MISRHQNCKAYQNATNVTITGNITAVFSSNPAPVKSCGRGSTPVAPGAKLSTGSVGIGDGDVFGIKVKTCGTE